MFLTAINGYISNTMSFYSLITNNDVRLDLEPSINALVQNHENVNNLNVGSISVTHVIEMSCYQLYPQGLHNMVNIEHSNTI